MKNLNKNIEKVKIYVVINCFENPNKVYIGKTKNSREKDHRKIYGNAIEYFYVDEVKSLDHKDWEPLETYWIEQFRQWGFEIMNKRRKGGSGPDFHTEKTKQKISQTTIGHKKSLETKTKMSLSHKGKILSKEIKDKISNSNKGKTFSSSHIDNLKKGHLKKDKDFYKNKKWLKNIEKPITQYDLKGNFIKDWSSIREASEYLNINRSSISQHLGGKQKTSGGYIWKYKEN
jgi:hypothetical protein